MTEPGKSPRRSRGVRFALGAILLAQVLALVGGGTLARASGPNAVVTDVGCRANTLAGNDDGSTGLVPLGFSANFFGTTHTGMYVNNNGDVTFGSPYSGYSGLNLSAAGRPLIAVAFFDVDTRPGATTPVQYGPTTFGGRPAYCVNWVNVGYYSGGTNRPNSSQLLLVDRSDTGAGNFDIVMNYDQLLYEPSGGLTVGYSNGSSVTYTYPGSGVAGALVDSNTSTGLTRHSAGSSQLGRYVYQVRGGQANAPGTQTVDFPQPADVSYGAAPFTVSPTASSGLPVTLTASGVCAASGTTVTVSAVGTCSLTASQAGTDVFPAATPVTRTFAVAKGAAVVTLTGLSQTYNGSPRPVTATSSPDPAGASWSVTYGGSAVPPTHAGSYPVLARVDSPTHTGSATGTLTVAKAAQTVTFPELAHRSLGDAPIALTATADSGLAVRYSRTGPCTLDGATVTLTGLGQCTVTAAQPGDADRQAADPVERSFAIGRGTAVVTLGGLSQTYDGTPRAVTTTSAPSVGGAAWTVSYDGSEIVPSHAGEYAVVASLDSPTYTGTAGGTLRVAKAGQAITFPELAGNVVGDDPADLHATADSALAIRYSATGPCAVHGITVTSTGAGQCTITAAQDGDRDHEAADPVRRSFAIGKGVATITLTDLNQVYDGDPKPVTPTVGPAGAGTLTVTYDGSTVAPAHAGTYHVVASVTGPDREGTATGTLVIGRAPQTIAFPELSDTVVGAGGIDLHATASSHLPAAYSAAGQCALFGVTLTVTGVGQCTVTATQDGDSDHEAAAPAQRAFAIGKGTATLVLASLDQVYDGTARAVTAGTDADLDDPTWTITYDGSAEPPVHPGDYAVVASLDSASYTGSVAGVLHVAKAPQAITFPEFGDQVVGDAPIVPGATASSGLAVEYAVTWPCALDGGLVTVTTAGDCTVTASQPGDADYEAAAAFPRTFSIARGVAAITLTGLNPTFDGTPKPVTAVASPVDAGTVNVHYDESSTAPTHAGVYPVTAVLDSPTYTGAAAGTLTIAKASQSVSFPALGGATYGDRPRDLAATASSGLPVHYSASGSCTVLSPAAGERPVSRLSFGRGGLCTVTVSQNGDADRWPAAAVVRELTVGRAAQSTSLTLADGLTVGGGEARIQARASSGLDVALTARGSCALDRAAAGTFLTPIHAGPCTVLATQSGDASYLPAAVVTALYQVSPGTAALTVSNVSQTANGTQHTVLVTTSPAGLDGVAVSYNGKSEPPSAPGVYTVVATLRNGDYMAAPVTASLTVALPDPAPVSDPATGTAPELAPGQAVTLIAGQAAPMTVTHPANGGLVFTGHGFTAGLAAVDVKGKSVALDSQGNLVVTRSERVLVSATGFAPSSRMDVWMFSTPALLGHVTTDAAGGGLGNLRLPAGLAPGHHSLQLNGFSEDGEQRSVTVGVTVAAARAGMTAPVAQAAPHESVSARAGEGGGLTTPATRVRVVKASRAHPYAGLARYEARAHATAVVGSAIAAFALVSVTAGSLSGMAGARTASAGGGTGAGLAAGAGAGAIAGRASARRERKEGRRKGGRVTSASAKHFKETWDGSGIGDRSRTWRWPGGGWLDAHSLALPGRVAPASPLLARILADASYLRAMLGTASVALPVLGVVLGALSAADVNGMALPPRPVLLLAVMVLGVFDALGGLLAALVFVGVVVACGGAGSLDAIRTLMGMCGLWFAIPLVAGAARPFRRPVPRSSLDWWTRACDIVMASAIGAWAAQKTIGALSGLAGHELPVTQLANKFALVVMGCIAIRIVAETGASWAYPNRLLTVRPERLPKAGNRQQMAALALKTVVFVLVAEAFLGLTWQLWAGTVLFVVPQVLSMYADNFPNREAIFSKLPKRMVKSVVMMVVGKGAAVALGLFIVDPGAFISYGFVLLTIPGLLLSGLELVGRDGPNRDQTWPRELVGAGIATAGIGMALGLIG